MGIVPYLLSALTALGLIASFPPFDVFPLMWIALVPLLAALYGKSRKQSFLLVFLAMLVFFLETLHWLSVFGWYAWVVSALFQALFPAVWGAVVSPFMKGGRISFLNILFPPLSFTAMEAVRNLGPLAMPWGDLAYTQSRFLPMIQMASVTGALGLSFVLVLVNVLFYFSWMQKKWTFCLGGLAVFMVPLLWGTEHLKKTFTMKARVALIQSNDLQTLKWDEAHYRRMLEELDRLVRRIQGKSVDLVVFPETALAGYLAQDPSLQLLVKSWAKELNTDLCVGTLLQKGDKPQNGMALIDRTGEWTQSYAKIKLVPFGEYLPIVFRPMRGKWHALDPIVDFAPGDQSTVFRRDGKTFGVMICFESSFGWIARALAVKGAQFLAISTNDAWFFGTPAQEMHAIMAIFRSVESGRSSVQAGNTGISMMSDPFGRVLAWQKPNESRVVFGEVPINSGLTWYDRYGDAFPYLCIFLTLLLLKRKSHGSP